MGILNWRIRRRHSSVAVASRLSPAMHEPLESRLLLSTLPDFTNMVVFGDSLSDTGNVVGGTSGIALFYGEIFRFVDHYETSYGCFTSCEESLPPAGVTGVWHQHLADMLNAEGLDVAKATPSDEGGLNYAHGGAVTAGGVRYLGVVDNVGRQIDDYLSHHGVDSDTLYVLWAGGNDLVDAADNADEMGPVRDNVREDALLPVANTAVQNIVGYVRDLINAGARHILWPNLPALSEIPHTREVHSIWDITHTIPVPPYLGSYTNATVKALANAVEEFNDQWESECDLLENIPNVTIYDLDVFSIFNMMLAGSFGGFTNTTEKACVKDDLTAEQTDGHLFWDGMHPTSRAHQLLGEAAYDWIVSEHTLTQVDSFFCVGTPSPIVQGGDLLLSARASNEGGSVNRVAFYRDANGNGVLDIGTDEYVGTDTYAPGGNWEWYGSVHWNPGRHTFFARALDNDGLWGSAAAISVNIESSPAEPGNDLEETGRDWDDGSGSGDGDGMLEAGERLKLKWHFRSADGARNVEATLTSDDPLISLAVDEVYFSDFAPGQSQPSSISFSMDLDFVLNPGGTRTVPFELTVTYELDSQEYYQEFSFSEIFYEQKDWTDFVFVPDGTPGSGSNVYIDDAPEYSFRNNGDHVLQSGEKVRIHPIIRNDGDTTATDINVSLASPESTPLDFVPADEDKYPDLNPGASGKALNDGYFWLQAPQGFAGDTHLDVLVRCAEAGGIATVPSALLVTVLPAPIIAVNLASGDREEDFGAVEPGELVASTMRVWNRGTDSLVVEGVYVSDDDTSVSVNETFSLEPNEHRDITITIDTSTIPSGSTITRTVSVVSNGRFADAMPPSDRVVVTGLVSYSVRVSTVPDAAPGDLPDVSDEWIVWEEIGPNGSDEIFAYSLLTEQWEQITDAPGRQSRPRISGHLIAWDDYRRGTPNADIYAFDRDTGQEFAVSTDPADEILVGVDDERIVFLRAYQTFTGAVAEEAKQAWNVWMYEVSTGALTNITGFSWAGGHGAAKSVLQSEGLSDMAGGLIAWNEITIEWLDDSWWASKRENDRIVKFQPGVDAQPVVLSEGRAQFVSVNEGRVAWQIEAPEEKTVKLPALQDTWFAATRSYGTTSNTATAGDWNDLQVRFKNSSGGNTQIYAALLQFDTSLLTADFGRTVSADLHIYMSSSPNSWAALELQRVTTPWDEATVSSNSFPQFTSYTRSDDRWTQDGWVVRALPEEPNGKDWVKLWATQANNGLMIRPYQEFVDFDRQMNGTFHFVSSEGDVSRRPYVEVTYETQAVCQWWVWESGSGEARRFGPGDPTFEDYADDVFVLGDGYLVHDSHAGEELFYWDFQESMDRLLQTDRGRLFWARADGSVATWSSEPVGETPEIRYAYLRRPDVALLPGDISFSADSLPEGGSIDVSLEVRNLTDYTVGDDIAIYLYDGDPDAAVREPWAQQVISGGLDGREARTVVFSGLKAPENATDADIEVHHVYARIATAAFEDISNNTLSKVLRVYDDDVNGPEISDLTVSEYNGDGDGVIGSDEQVRIAWDLSDPSGIATVELLLDGSPVALDGSNHAIVGPLGAGDHEIMITAVDADNTPASTQLSADFEVVSAEVFAVYYDGDRLIPGALVDFGLAAQGSNAVALLGLRNLGEQLLTVGDISVPAGFTVTSPPEATVEGGGSTYFVMAMNTTTLAAYPPDSVSVFTSDADSHFAFDVAGVVKCGPTANDDINVFALEDGGAVAIDVLANDTYLPDPPETLTVIETTEAAHGTVVITGAGSGVAYHPDSDFYGQDEFSYTIIDEDGLTDSALVSITVTPVNDAPSFVAGEDVTVLVDAGAQVIPGWATDIVAGPEDEAYQDLEFELANDNAALFSIQPDLSSDGTLTFTPADGAGGSATVSVILRDDGGTANGGEDESAVSTFVITVGQVVPLDSRGLWQGFDADGELVTVALRGPGTGTVLLAGAGNADPLQITLEGTTPRSSLIITTRGRGSSTTVGSIVVEDGALRSLVANTTTLVGAGIEVTGATELGADSGYIGVVRVGDLVNGADIIMSGAAPNGVVIRAGSMDDGTDISLPNGGLRALVASQWVGGSLEVRAALSIAITGDRRGGLAGDLGASLTFTDDWGLTRLRVAGAMDGTDIMTPGTIGTIVAGAWAEGSLTADWLGNMVVRGDLGADVTLTGAHPRSGFALQRLNVVGTMTDPVISAQSGAVGTIVAGQWDDGSLNATWASNVVVRGDLGADLSLSGAHPRNDMALGRLTVRGTMTGSTITADSGSVGTIVAGQWDEGSLTATWAGNVVVRGDLGVDVTLTGAHPRSGFALQRLNVVGTMTDPVISAQSGAVGTIVAGQWDAGALNATWASNVVVRGDLGADLSLSGAHPRNEMALGRLTVRGTMSGSTITADSGSVGTIVAGQWDEGSLTAEWVGNMVVRGDLGADVTLTGDRSGLALGRLNVMDTITDSVISATSGGAGAIVAGQWDDGSLTAKWVGNVVVRGSLGADVTLTGENVPARRPTLGRAVIAGDLAGATWDVQDGLVGAVVVRGTVLGSVVRSDDDIRSITVGASNGSAFGAGVALDTLDSLRKDEIDEVVDAPQAAIGAFTVRGTAFGGRPDQRFFVNSHVVANVGKMNVRNSDEQSALFAAAGGVGIVRHIDTADRANSWVWPAPPNQGVSAADDFVRIL